MPYNYNINPAPQTGSGAYGSVPGQIGLPPNIYSQVSKIPGAGGLAPVSAGFIGTELAGQVSPEAQNLLQQKSAIAGIRSGMPGGSFAQNNYLQNLGLTSEGLQRQGSQDYLSFLTGTGSEMTSPNLAYEVAQQNALNRAAPNPAAAAAALTSLSGGGRGGGGWTLAPSAGGGSPPSLPTGGWDPNAGYANPPVAYGPGWGAGSFDGGPVIPPIAPSRGYDQGWDSSVDWNLFNSTELGNSVSNYIDSVQGGYSDSSSE